MPAESDTVRGRRTGDSSFRSGWYKGKVEEGAFVDKESKAHYRELRAVCHHSRDDAGQ